MTLKTSDGMTGSLSSIGIRNPFRRGQQIRVPAGTPARSTHPRRDGVFVTKRAQTVTLLTATDGYVDLWNDARMGRGYVHLPTVCWVGTGGYYVDVKVTPEFAAALGVDAPVLPVLSDYDRRSLDAEPGFGFGYDNRDA